MHGNLRDRRAEVGNLTDACIKHRLAEHVSRQGVRACPCDAECQLSVANECDAESQLSVANKCDAACQFSVANTCDGKRQLPVVSCQPKCCSEAGHRVFVSLFLWGGPPPQLRCMCDSAPRHYELVAVPKRREGAGTSTSSSSRAEAFTALTGMTPSHIGCGRIRRGLG